MLGSPILYLRGTRIVMFQLSGFYYKTYSSAQKQHSLCTALGSVRRPETREDWVRLCYVPRRGFCKGAVDATRVFPLHPKCSWCEVQMLPRCSLNPQNIGALIITYNILVVPYYDYGIMGPKTLF